MFIYCLNNPVNTVDPSGNACVSIIKRESSDMPVTIPQPAPTPEEQRYGVVNGQDLLPYSKTKIGLGSYGKSGCSYIAAYNALQLLGEYKTLSAVTEDILNNYGSVLWGAGGVMPKTLERYLSDQGLNITGSKDLGILLDNVTEGTVITFTVMNNAKNPFKGWHAMTAQYSNGEYSVFNRYSNRSSTYTYSSLTDAIEGGAFLYGVRIDP